MSVNDDMIARVITREGGYVDHPDDKGGPTKYGITMATLRAEWRRPVSAKDIRHLTREQAASIYARRYLIGPNFHRIEDERLREIVFDAGVLHGTGWAAKRLQECVGVKADGIIGPVTLKALRSEKNGLSGDFIRRRIHKVARIVQHDPSQLVFLAGWLKRAAAFVE